MSPGMIWRYIGNIARTRRTSLEHPRPATELPAALVEGFTIACYHRDQGQSDSSYARAVFCGVVEPNLFDWFFNAQTGYRGAYFQSPEAGIAFNRNLIDASIPALTTWAASRYGADAAAWSLKSLSASSAKAWLAEHPGLCAQCAGEWSSSHAADLSIQNGRWEQADHTHSEWGRQAPIFTKIRIFGGLINADGKEWIAPHKLTRSADISANGWT